MERVNEPVKPQRIVTKDGRWEIVPDVEIYRVTTLDPITPEQHEKAEELGPMIRILYCAKTYDMAVSKGDKLVKTGVLPNRIEYVYAQRDTVQAILDGKFEVVAMSEAS